MSAPATLSTPNLTHIALHCADLNRSVDFYDRMCGLKVVHKRQHAETTVAWIAEPGRECRLVMVLIGGAKSHARQAEDDFSHLGFAVATKASVDDIVASAVSYGYEVSWQPTELPYPVGYFCGVRDPDGNVIEFSYGQPLGPGSEDKMRKLIAETAPA